ncbi:hypothetical protein PEPNEM18_01505 [Aedoeadaptatus nemausensis]|uniref:Uncharacterized protein n=1 Tax=Aedoeadaptatus nemausensis TaxID=2582829 RepID=A0A6V6Y725_9FIRM|nr:CBO2463/CBO2479 domain-containing protein [Peptoniphilus nemausensis]CAC9935466.1 hypothetical protein PEPNEM18_01505 [Peptoniphilus nemausensis]
MKYQIQPVKVTGKIKKFDSIDGDKLKIHLSGRLGVLVIGKDMILNIEEFERDRKLSFYYSYITVQDQPFDNDVYDLVNQEEPSPCIVSGTISEVNDTAIEVKMNRDLGWIRVPRRTMITNVVLEEGLPVEFYLSKAQVITD